MKEIKEKIKPCFGNNQYGDFSNKMFLILEVTLPSPIYFIFNN